jgi:hypothetical protein
LAGSGSNSEGAPAFGTEKTQPLRIQGFRKEVAVSAVPAGEIYRERRSSEVALILRSMDYRRDKVKVLEGGLIQWDAKGYPMIKNEVPE